MRIKRSKYCLAFLKATEAFDVQAFLQGNVLKTSTVELTGYSPLSGEEISLRGEDLDRLTRIADDRWQDVDGLATTLGVPASWLMDLAAQGFLLTDEPMGPRKRWREIHDRVDSESWNPAVAAFHLASLHLESSAAEAQGDKEVDLTEMKRNSAEDTEAFLERHGPPPEAFQSRPDAAKNEPLPRPEYDQEDHFFKTLLERKTHRTFEPQTPLGLETLSRLLHLTFGHQGLYRLSPEVFTLHKTSPSGGSLHPIEAYPVVHDVQGLAPGLYHYRAEDHSLELLREISADDLRSMTVGFAQGQTFVGTAQAAIVLVARFARNFWKYKRQLKTYAVVHQDAGHLNQTFHLTATRLGLGAFYTAAIDPLRIAEALDLPTPSESALGICGCGVKTPDDPSSPDLEPSSPGPLGSGP
ncbi:MAG: putative peptide maturation dehydrogenase [Acidobacteriota bacterium]